MDKIDQLLSEVLDLAAKEKITVDQLRVFIPDYTRMFPNCEDLCKEDLLICVLEFYVEMMQQQLSGEQLLLHRLSFGCDPDSS